MIEKEKRLPMVIVVSRNDAYVVAHELRKLQEKSENKAESYRKNGKCPGDFTDTAERCDIVASQLFSIVDDFNKENKK